MTPHPSLAWGERKTPGIVSIASTLLLNLHKIRRNPSVNHLRGNSGPGFRPTSQVPPGKPGPCNPLTCNYSQTFCHLLLSQTSFLRKLTTNQVYVSDGPQT